MFQQREHKRALLVFEADPDGERFAEVLERSATHGG